MLNIFKGNKLSFRGEMFKESTQDCNNPARGWYQIHTFKAEEPFCEEDTIWCLSKEDSLALVLIDIGAYRGKELDEQALSNIENIIRWFSLQGKDVVLRVVYDCEGKGIQREPGSYELVKKHFLQVMAAVKDGGGVFIYQGLLVGSWGEMHDSRYITKDRLAGLEAIIAKEHPCEYYAVRSPMFWRWLRDGRDGAFQELSMEASESMGLFDDGMLGSETNLGTYGCKEDYEVRWHSKWCPQQEYDFIRCIAGVVPVGGEAVLPEMWMDNECAPKLEDAEDIWWQQQEERLSRMCVTYLNRVHDKRLIELWKTTRWQSEDIWNESSVYDYIGSHMGYRYVVRDVKGARSARGFCINVIIDNVGYAPIYQETEVLLIWDDGCMNTETQRIDVDLRKLQGGSRLEINCHIAGREGALYLQLRRKSDGRVIRLANISEYEDKIKLGTLTPE